jgi:hypothetical protein
MFVHGLNRVVHKDIVITPGNTTFGWTSGTTLDTVNVAPGTSASIVNSPTTGSGTQTFTFSSTIDATKNSFLTFWMYSPSITRNDFQIALGINGISNFYYFNIIVGWQGWRKISLDLDRVQKGGASFPSSNLLNSLVRLQIKRIFSDLTSPDTTNTFLFSDFRFSDSGSTGQFSTKFDEFITNMDSSIPEILTIKSLTSKIEQMEQLGAYFKNRILTWEVDINEDFPHTSYTPTANSTSVYNDWINGKFTAGGRSHTFGSPLDVSYAPEFATNTASISANADDWSDAFIRATYTEDLLSYYWSRSSRNTDEATFIVNGLVDQLKQYYIDRPYRHWKDNFSGTNKQSSLNVGIRLYKNLIYVWMFLCKDPRFTNVDAVCFMISLYDYCKFIFESCTLKNLGGETVTNYISFEMTGLYCASVLLYDNTYISNTLKTFSISEMQNMVDINHERNIFNQDGFIIELTTGYHGAMMDNIERALAVSSATGNISDLTSYSAQISGSILDAFKKVYEFCVYFSGAETSNSRFYMPRVNDAWDVSSSTVSKFAYSIWNEPLFEWAASRETTEIVSNRPLVIDYNFPYSGFTVSRTGWDRTDSTLWFDNGQLGTVHVHQDKLNVIFWVRGRNLIFDSGGEDYDTSVANRYGTSTNSHNCLIVDNKGQLRNTTVADKNGYGNPLTPSSKFNYNDDFTYSIGYYWDGWSDTTVSSPAAAQNLAKQKRQVIFFKQKHTVIVIDDVETADSNAHTYQTRWHADSTSYSISGDNLITTNAGRTNISIRSGVLNTTASTSVAVGSNTPYEGWYVKKGLTNTACITLKYTTASTTNNVKIITILSGLDVGESSDSINNYGFNNSTQYFINYVSGETLNIVETSSNTIQITYFDGVNTNIYNL